MGHDRSMRSPRTFGAIVLASLVMLGACGGSDADSDGADTTATVAADGTAPASEPPATEPAPTEPPATEPAPTEPTVTEPPAPEAPATEAPAATAAPATEAPGEESGADCLVGDWVITEAEMNAYYDALEATLSASGPAPTFDIAGQALVTFTPATYTYTADFDLTLGVSGQEGTGTSTGTVSGTWTPVDGVIVGETTDSDLTVSVSIGGITFDGTELANGLLDSSPINAAPFDCAGPTLDFQTGAGTPRHSVTLTPA